MPKTRSKTTFEQRIRDNTTPAISPHPSGCSAYDKAWEAMFVRLQEYKKKHNGHCDVPHGYEDQPLARWVSKQRLKLRDAPLDNPRRQKLDNIGLSWRLPTNPPKPLPCLVTLNEVDQWDVFYERLKDYKSVRGDCNVPLNYEEDKSLAIWVSQERAKLKNAPPSDSRKQKLDSLGFLWMPSDISWGLMFQRLLNYKRINEDCDVPHGYIRDRMLAHWVSDQRILLRDAPDDDPRRQKLDSIGFTWRPSDVSWELMFQRLLDYKQMNGDCNVPRGYVPDKSLAQWVSKQRKLLRDAPQDDPRRQKLDSIGFTWHRLPEKCTVKWDTMFKRLTNYIFKQHDKSWSLSSIEIEDPLLLVWTRQQHQLYLQNKLPLERRSALNMIGFRCPHHPLYPGLGSGAAAMDHAREECEHCAMELDEASPTLGQCGDERNGLEMDLGLPADDLDYSGKGLDERIVARMEDTMPPDDLENSRKGSDEEDVALMEVTMPPDDLLFSRDGSGELPVPFSVHKDLNQSDEQRQRSQETIAFTLSGVPVLNKLQDKGSMGDGRGEEANEWDTMYQQLIAFQQEHGHCYVPVDSEPYKQLALWAQQQHGQLKYAPSHDHWRQKLDAVGFPWIVSREEQCWKDMLAVLVGYIAVDGMSSLDPLKCADPVLACWIPEQNQRYWLDLMPLDQRYAWEMFWSHATCDPRHDYEGGTAIGWASRAQTQSRNVSTPTSKTAFDADDSDGIIVFDSDSAHEDCEWNSSTIAQDGSLLSSGTNESRLSKSYADTIAPSPPADAPATTIVSTMANGPTGNSSCIVS